MISRNANVLNGGNRPRRALGDVTNSRQNKNVGGKQNHVVVKRASNPTIDERAVVRPRQNAVEVIRKPVEETKKAKASSDYQFTGRCDDIDIRDADDPLSVTSYVQDMFEHFAQKEKVTCANPDYMELQPHINSRMRAILVDWLLDVHQKFRMVPETLYLTINIIDRFLSKAEITRDRLQLVGVTALLLGSKYEEIYPPTLQELVSICDGACDDSQILKMEETILVALKYNVTIPSAHIFLVRFLKAAHGSRKIVQFSCYILDSTLTDYKLLKYLPSQIAGAAVMIARMKCGRNAWSPTLVKYTNYFEEDIIPVAQDIVKAMNNREQHLEAVEKKYARERFGAVAGTTFFI